MSHSVFGFFCLFCNTLSVLRPAQILADHLVESLIVLGKVTAQARHYHRIDVRMLASLRLAQTLVGRVRAQTVEALRLVEIEIVPTDAMLQTYRPSGCRKWALWE